MSKLNKKNKKGKKVKIKRTKVPGGYKYTGPRNINDWIKPGSTDNRPYSQHVQRLVGLRELVLNDWSNAAREHGVSIGRNEATWRMAIHEAEPERAQPFTGTRVLLEVWTPDYIDASDSAAVRDYIDVHFPGAEWKVAMKYEDGWLTDSTTLDKKFKDVSKEFCGERVIMTERWKNIIGTEIWNNVQIRKEHYERLADYVKSFEKEEGKFLRSQDMSEDTEDDTFH